MAKQNRTVGLIAFLKGSSNPKERMPGCADYDHHSGCCLCSDVCFVQSGQRCDHFEKVVLPTATDFGLKERVYSLYAKHVGIEGDCPPDDKPIRRCPGTDRYECGILLPPNKRYCDKCRDERRRDSYRKRRQKKIGWCATVKFDCPPNSGVIGMFRGILWSDIENEYICPHIAILEVNCGAGAIDGYK